MCSKHVRVSDSELRNALMLLSFQRHKGAPSTGRFLGRVSGRVGGPCRGVNDQKYHLGMSTTEIRKPVNLRSAQTSSQSLGTGACSHVTC